MKMIISNSSSVPIYEQIKKNYYKSNTRGRTERR